MSDEMWALFEQYQPYADKKGHGSTWHKMTTERTQKLSQAAADAADAAWQRSAAWAAVAVAAACSARAKNAADADAAAWAAAKADAALYEERAIEYITNAIKEAQQTSDQVSNKMWKAMEDYQPYAEIAGYGESWRRMTTERTERAMRSAQCAARANSWWAASPAAKNAADADADAAAEAAAWAAAAAAASAAENAADGSAASARAKNAAYAAHAAWAAAEAALAALHEVQAIECIRRAIIIARSEQ